MTNGTRTNFGIASLVLGIVGLCIIWIPLVGIASIVLGILAIIFGALAYWGKNRRDVFGLAGFILGLIIIILVIISIIISAMVYVYVSGMLSPPPGGIAPNIAWTKDNTNYRITITAGFSSYRYASSSSVANIIFKKSGVNYYVDSSYSLTSIESGLCTAPIQAGNVITGFTAGTYQVVWEPTDKLLGDITFT